MATTLLDELHAIRVRANMIEARLSALRPDPDDAPDSWTLWEQGMTHAGEQFAAITRAIRDAADRELEPVIACVECGLPATVVGIDGDPRCNEHGIVAPRFTGRDENLEDGPELVSLPRPVEPLSVELGGPSRSLVFVAWFVGVLGWVLAAVLALVALTS
jgi:hypothetical protein